MNATAHLIGFGADLQQKLDAMDSRNRRVRWAGDVGIALHGIARRLHRLGAKAARSGIRPADLRKERRLVETAIRTAAELGRGVHVIRQPDPRGWPLVVVFPSDVPPGSGFEANYEQGIAVPPRP